MDWGKYIYYVLSYLNNFFVSHLYVLFMILGVYLEDT